MSMTDTLRGARYGVAAGLAGTTAMTAAQAVYYKLTDAEPSTTPAEVAKRIIRGVLQRDVSDDATPQLNQVMHWLYGCGWGTLYGLSSRSPGRGIGFGTVLWGASLIELPAMQLAPPIWETPPSGLAPDLGFHLVYGVAAAHMARRLWSG